MRLFVLLNLALLGCIWSFAESIRIMPENPLHSEDINPRRNANELGGNFVGRLDIKRHFKSLMAFNFEEYSDMEAPPGLSEASHGPILFFRPKRKKHPPVLHPQAEPQAEP
eukprot:c3039_g1_i1 orf=395-727(+)